MAILSFFPDCVKVQPRSKYDRSGLNRAASPALRCANAHCSARRLEVESEPGHQNAVDLKRLEDVREGDDQIT